MLTSPQFSFAVHSQGRPHFCLMEGCPHGTNEKGLKDRTNGLNMVRPRPT
jgi:hypothetical protein